MPSLYTLKHCAFFSPIICLFWTNTIWISLIVCSSISTVPGDFFVPFHIFLGLKVCAALSVHYCIWGSIWRTSSYSRTKISTRKCFGRAATPLWWTYLVAFTFIIYLRVFWVKLAWMWAQNAACNWIIYELIAPNLVDELTLFDSLAVLNPSWLWSIINMWKVHTWILFIYFSLLWDKPTDRLYIFASFSQNLCLLQSKWNDYHSQLLCIKDPTRSESQILLGCCWHDVTLSGSLVCLSHFF